jgi:hypothetical protein
VVQRWSLRFLVGVDQRRCWGMMAMVAVMTHRWRLGTMATMTWRRCMMTVMI